MEMNRFFLSLCAFTFLTVSAPAFAGNLVTGISSCIMKINESAGTHTPGSSYMGVIREPANYDYNDHDGPYLFGNPTFWKSMDNYYAKVGSTTTSFRSDQKAYWGAAKTYLDANAKRPGVAGTNTSFLPSGVNKGSGVGPNVTTEVGNDGWTYVRGAYFKTVNYLVNGGSGSYQVYGIYRFKNGLVTSNPLTVMSSCKSVNSSSEPWLNENFLTSGEINNAFSEFESNITKIINQKSLDLSVIAEFADVVESASAGEKISFGSNSFFGVTKSSSSTDVDKSNSDDAISLQKIFKNY